MCGELDAEQFFANSYWSLLVVKGKYAGALIWIERGAKRVLAEIRPFDLMVFSTTYLYKQGFSALLSIKSKQRNKLNPINDMSVALSKSIKPYITELVQKMQAHKSYWKHVRLLYTGSLMFHKFYHVDFMLYCLVYAYRQVEYITEIPFQISKQAV